MTTIHNEKRFEHKESPASSSSESPLPDLEQAEGTHYAYDPETYEVVCRPGQRLTQRKAQRLQELRLYAHVVTFTK